MSGGAARPAPAEGVTRHPFTPGQGLQPWTRKGAWWHMVGVWVMPQCGLFTYCRSVYWLAYSEVCDSLVLCSFVGAKHGACVLYGV
ncbi:MAG: hypothetical protein Fur005_05580 [Roseiflexaceae bacterium]